MTTVRRNRSRVLIVVVACALSIRVGPVVAKKKVVVKKTTTTTLAPRLKPARIPAMSSADAVGYCRNATNTKATLAEIRLKKQQLGSKTPATLYRQEIAADQTFAKVSPKELAPDFVVMTNYLGLFVKLADTKDASQLGVVSSQLSSDQVLSDYLDATIRIEGFVRRTCGFPVGI